MREYMSPNMSDPRYYIQQVANDPSILLPNNPNKNIKAYTYDQKKDLLIRINAYIADNKNELLSHFEDGNYIEALDKLYSTCSSIENDLQKGKRFYHSPPPTAEKTKEIFIEFKLKNSLAVRPELPNEMWQQIIGFLPIKDKQNLADTSVNLRDNVEAAVSAKVTKAGESLNFQDHGIITDDDLVIILNNLTKEQKNGIKKLDFSGFHGRLLSPELAPLLAQLTNLEEIHLINYQNRIFADLSPNMAKQLNLQQVHTFSTQYSNDVRIFTNNSHVKSLLIGLTNASNLKYIAENFQGINSLQLFSSFGQLDQSQGDLLSQMKTLETLTIGYFSHGNDAFANLHNLPVLKNLTVSIVSDQQLTDIGRCNHLQQLFILNYNDKIHSTSSIQDFFKDTHPDCEVTFSTKPLFER